MKTKLCLFTTFLLTLFDNGGSSDMDFISSPSNLQKQIDLAERNVSNVLHSRKRRYVTFPEGSTFTVAFCVSVKALTGVDNIFTEGVNWALSYDLPNETLSSLKSPAPLPLRRQKRDLYERVEILLNSAGFDGRLCLLRTICETAQLIPPREGVVQEIIRLIFTYPLAEAANPGKHREYANAHTQGITDTNCFDTFPCPISLLDLLLQFGTKNSRCGAPNSYGVYSSLVMMKDQNVSADSVIGKAGDIDVSIDGFIG